MSVAFIFPGQGSQANLMGKDFYDKSDTAKSLFEKANDALGYSFEKLMFEEDDRLNISEFSQPAIVLASVVALELFKSKYPALSPAFVMGHSLGEFSALYATGALKLESALRLVSERGKLMQKAAGSKEAGMCVILGLKDEIVEACCTELRESGKEVWAANYNSEGQVVIAGIKHDIESSQDFFKEKGAKRVLMLNMSVSSHNPLLQSIEEDFGVLLETYVGDSFSVPVISNVTAQPYASKKEAIEVLKQQLTKPVLYRQSIAANESRCDCFLEFGHGAVLAGLNKKITQKETISINTMDKIENYKG